MSRRNVPRPVIPTKTSVPARSKNVTEQQEQQKKRQKTSVDAPPPSSSHPAPAEKVQVTPADNQPINLDLEVGVTGSQTDEAARTHFSPTYTFADGRVVLLKDSVKEEPSLAVTMLRGLALPRDVDQVPTELLPGLSEMCSHIVQAGQAALKAYDKAVKVSAERERYRADRDSFRTRWRNADQETKEAEAEVELLKKELAEAKKSAKIAEAEVRRMREEEKEKLKEADMKGYAAGIKRAALEYTQTAHQMVNDELAGRLPGFFTDGYTAGAKAMAEVLAVEADSGFLKKLPPAEVPDLQLPYTEEECEPLPPEDDEDEVMMEAEHQEKAGEDAIKEGALKNAAEAQREADGAEPVQLG